MATLQNNMEGELHSEVLIKLEYEPKPVVEDDVPSMAECMPQNIIQDRGNEQPLEGSVS